jgi:hypothetical protein
MVAKDTVCGLCCSDGAVGVLSVLQMSRCWHAAGLTCGKESLGWILSWVFAWWITLMPVLWERASIVIAPRIRQITEPR